MCLCRSFLVSRWPPPVAPGIAAPFRSHRKVKVAPATDQDPGQAESILPTRFDPAIVGRLRFTSAAGGTTGGATGGTAMVTVRMPSSTSLPAAPVLIAYT